MSKGAVSHCPIKEISSENLNTWINNKVSSDEEKLSELYKQFKKAAQGQTSLTRRKFRHWLRWNQNKFYQSPHTSKKFLFWISRWLGAWENVCEELQKPCSLQIFLSFNLFIKLISYLNPIPVISCISVFREPTKYEIEFGISSSETNWIFKNCL